MFAKLILTKAMIEGFIINGCLNSEDEQIVKLRMLRWSREKIAEEMHISVSTLDKRIKRLKNVYDQVRKMHPELELPER